MMAQRRLGNTNLSVKPTLAQNQIPDAQDNLKLNAPKTTDLSLGHWERSLAWRDADFARDDEVTHPHIKRRKDILAAHPIIRRLFVKDYYVIPIIAFGVLNQILIAWICGRSTSVWSWPLIVASAGVIGGSIVDLMAVCVHECCHGVVSNSPLVNKLFAFLCNVGTPVPIAMSFRRYHSDHHVYQGSERNDPDMPLEWELKYIKGSFAQKLLWLVIYPAMYAVRAITRGRTVSGWETANTIFTLTLDIIFYLLLGSRGLAYILLSFAIGYTFHPVAAHFLQEHYTFASGQETYNYYGWANTLYLNIGFHNEHHDFPTVPARYLPLITKIAPEYYQPLLAHKSWRRVLWAFLTDTNIGPQSRCARD